MSDTFVLICNEDHDFYGISDDMDKDEHLQLLGESISREEITHLIDRERFENDVREGFRDGRAAVWKQFFVDMRRQQLSVDGHMGKHMEYKSVVNVMKRLVRRVMDRRTSYRDGLREEEKRRVERLKEDRRLRYKRARERVMLPGFLADMLTTWITSTFGGTLVDWLLPPQESPATIANACEKASVRQSLSQKFTITMVDNQDSAIKTFTAGGAAAGPQRRTASDDIPPTPEVRPEDAGIHGFVDTLALFCQQGVVARVFELLNNQYAKDFFDVHVSDSSDCLSIQVYEQVNEDGEPDICIKIEKSFRLFHISDRGKQDIGVLATDIEFYLFADEQVQMKWKGSKTAESPDLPVLV
ncbi:hypothetical protein DIPPA_29459 [Diplonema papillatum]|nr:hypothetical protein DIPPA_29459 [Diplonema papillatum]